MTDLTPNHPAVEAAHSATDAWMDDVQHKLPNDQMVHVLDTAIPHLTADDLRDTPAGRALMAEAWAQRRVRGTTPPHSTRATNASPTPTGRATHEHRHRRP